MIPVALAAKPPDFDEKVREPGLRAIAERVGKVSPYPRKRGSKNVKVADDEKGIPPDKFPDYWTEILPEMRLLYKDRCAYTAMYIPLGVGTASVDHILPKSHYWEHVYEWENYALCCKRFNELKGDSTLFVNPFKVGLNWFALNILNMHIERGDSAPDEQFENIDTTLKALNSIDFIMLRGDCVNHYYLGPEEGGFCLAYFEKRAPFLASELRRQGANTLPSVVSLT